MNEQPTLKLYEPPLDDGEGDEDVPEMPPESRHAGFCVCLVLGATAATAIWMTASHFVP